jgi:hypothetical protein
MKSSTTSKQLNSDLGSPKEQVPPCVSFLAPAEVRQRADEIRAARAGGLGNELDDLFRAEIELLAERERPIGPLEPATVTNCQPAVTRLPSKRGRSIWEQILIWCFVVFSFAALVLCIYIIKAKCEGNWPIAVS